MDVLTKPSFILSYSNQLTSKARGKAMLIEVQSKAKDLLSDAMLRITPVECWTQNVLARDSDGNKAIATGSCATSWCAWGSVLKSLHNWNKEAYDTDAWIDYQRLSVDVKLFIHNKMLHAIPVGQTIGGYNDNRTHKTILRWFMRAIELCDVETADIPGVHDFVKSTLPKHVIAFAGYKR